MSSAVKKTAGPRATAFACHAPAARQVFLAGTFNDWSTSAAPMRRSEDGRWTIDMPLAPGRYEYKFLVDGAWCCEAGCEGSMAEARCPTCVANEFGTMNRVVEVK